jgi:pre-mRNA-processing factor SLU7
MVKMVNRVLKHQRKDNFNPTKFGAIGDPSQRGKFKGPAATVFRDGACKNCGSMTHSAKSCVERPRKIGAVFTGDDIKPDETIRNVDLDYEGSHDRWNGYDPEMYKKVMEEFEESDLARRRKIADERAKQFMTEQDPATATTMTEEAENDKKKVKIAEEGEKKQRLKEDATSTKVVANNLRIREDRAKYLINLDPDSAFYDPKSRSMRENPNLGKDDDDVTFMGDNATRLTGETMDFLSLQKYAWENYGIANVAAPSEVEVLYEEFRRKKEVQEQEKKNKLVAEYGGDEHVSQIPMELIYGQSEEYKEYNAEGNLLPKFEVIPPTPKTKYTEDLLTHGHTTVWGSYYDKLTGKWGYKCCHQVLKNAFCVGLEVKKEEEEFMNSMPTVLVTPEKVEKKRKRSKSKKEKSKDKDKAKKSKKHKKVKKEYEYREKDRTVKKEDD